MESSSSSGFARRGGDGHKRGQARRLAVSLAFLFGVLLATRWHREDDHHATRRRRRGDAVVLERHQNHHHHHREEQLVGKRGHKQLRADFVDEEDFDEEKEEEEEEDKEEEEELGTRELLEQSLRMARLSAYFLAKASWPQVKRMKRVGAWTATRAMETVTSSLMTRRNDDEDDKEEEEKEKAFSAVRFARKVFAYVVLYMFVRNSALTARKVLTRRFGETRATVRAAVEQRRVAIGEFVGKGWRKIERGTRRKVWEPLARAMRRMRQMKAFWTQTVPRAIAESGGKFWRRTVRFLGFLGKVVPHVVFFYCAKVVMTRAVPTVLRISVLRTRYCFASVGFLYPILKTLRAIESGREDVADTDDDDGEEGEVRAKKEQREEIEKWARYWVAIGPLALLADVPFLSTSVGLFWPSWLEMCCVFVLWLEMPFMNGAYFTIDTVFAPMYNRFASARRRRRREKKRIGKVSMKSSGSASSLSMMMASALRSDADDDESDDEYAEEDDVFDEDDDDKSHGGTDNDDDDNDDDNDDDDEDDDDNNTDGRYRRSKYSYSSSSESAASESSLSLFLSRKKKRENEYGMEDTGGLRRRRPPPHRHRRGGGSQGELPPLPPLRVEKQRQTRRKAKTKKRSRGLVRYRNALTRKVGDASKRVIIAWLRACVSVIGMFSPRLGEISRVALENTTGALLACSLFFLVPGMFCRYGCAIAGIFVPCLKSLETITSSSSTSTKATTHSSANRRKTPFFLAGNDRVPKSGDGEDNDGEERTRARTRIPTSRSEKLCAQLQYWVAWSLLWAVAREINQSSFGWFPLARHLELAGIYWLQVFGGAGVVTQKVKNVKDAIVLEHQNVFRAALQDVRDDDDDDDDAKEERQQEKRRDEQQREKRRVDDGGDDDDVR